MVFYHTFDLFHDRVNVCYLVAGILSIFVWATILVTLFVPWYYTEYNEERPIGSDFERIRLEYLTLQETSEDPGDDEDCWYAEDDECLGYTYGATESKRQDIHKEVARMYNAMFSFALAAAFFGALMLVPLFLNSMWYCRGLGITARQILRVVACLLTTGTTICTIVAWAVHFRRPGALYDGIDDDNLCDDEDVGMDACTWAGENDGRTALNQEWDYTWGPYVGWYLMLFASIGMFPISILSCAGGAPPRRY